MQKVTSVHGWVVRAGERAIGHVSGEHRARELKRSPERCGVVRGGKADTEP